MNDNVLYQSLKLGLISFSLVTIAFNVQFRSGSKAVLWLVRLNYRFAAGAVVGASAKNFRVLPTSLCQGVFAVAFAFESVQKPFGLL